MSAATQAELPNLFHFDEGSKIHSVVDWSRRLPELAGAIVNFFGRRDWHTLS